MAAPSIPNLNTLRSRGGGGGLRGLARRRGGNPDGHHNPHPQHDASEETLAARRDTIVKETDNDASSSRMSAVGLHYLDDPFARPFSQGQIVRRYPIINRGTYVRTTGIDRLVDAFLDTNPDEKKQIVSLGAGSDTRFFRRARPKLVYHELDFPSNTAAKIQAIQQHGQLKDTIARTLPVQDALDALHINDEKTQLTSPTYNIHPIDIRDLSAQAKPDLPNLDTTLPTLVLSECCLCYILPQVTDQLLSFFTSSFPSSTPLSLVLYEPIRPFDSFGKTMITNLASRGIELQTVKKYYSLGAQRERLKKLGFDTGQGARDIEQIYYGLDQEAWIGAEERNRVERLEWLDEVEEWKLLGRHYCIAWAWRDNDDANVFSKAWTAIGGQYTDAERGDDVV